MTSVSKQSFAFITEPCGVTSFVLDSFYYWPNNWVILSFNFPIIPRFLVRYHLSRLANYIGWIQVVIRPVSIRDGQHDGFYCWFVQHGMTISWYSTKGICFYIGFSRLIENLEIIVGQGGNPSLTSGIKLG